MTAHLKQDEADERCVLDHTQQGLIGTSIQRPDGLAKVTGTAPYAAEYLVNGCLEGVLVTAPFGRGRITAIEEKSVLGMDGVVAVITDKRLTTRPAQGTAGEAPKQEPHEVCYFGQPIALVVAETFEQASHAARHLALECEIDELSPAQLDPEAADAEPDDEFTRKGDLAHAMKVAATAIDLEYTTDGHASAAMEPHAAIAEWDGETLTAYSSLQMPNYNISELADALGLEEDKVRLIARYVGGGFGSKLGVSEETVGAALAAMKLERPVRVVMTRQQVFQCVMRRSETSQRLRLAVDGDGKLTGFGHEALVSNLPGEDFAEPVTQSSEFLYAGENRLLGIKVARIHRMTAGSVRAPGEAVGMPALEMAMDELAEKAGIDPVEFRLQNIPDCHPANGKPFSSRKLAECLRQGSESFGWNSGPRKPRQTREGEWWVGTGMASAARVHNISKAKARVSLQRDGSALVETDMTDIGTGTYSVLAQVVGEMLGLQPKRVLVDLGDTRHPRGPGSGGSWGAASIASAAFLACGALRERIAEKLGVEADALTLKDGEASGPNISIPLADLLADEVLTEEGFYEPGEASKSHVASSFGAFFAQVRVNRFTGETRVDQMLGAFGFGRVLSARSARSQCLGGLTWSIGMALTEGLLFDPNDGHLVNCDLAEYHVPVHRDVPDCDVLMIEERDPWASPVQAKGMGELAFCGGPAAIGNAIYNACGARLHSFPMTPDRVIAAMPV